MATTTDKTSTEAYRAMLGVEKYLASCSIEKPLRHLIVLHVSQLNGCAFCIDMHWKDARASNETEQRLYGLPAWRESPYYSERERAGLLLAEEWTRLSARFVPEDISELARAEFSSQEMADLAWIVASINTWNRVNIALKTVPGNYQPPRADR